MADHTALEELEQILADKEREEEDDEYLTEEEEEALEAEERRKLSRFARGCLEVAVFMLILAGTLTILESRGISVLYILPPYVLTLSCVAASFLAMMTGLISLQKTTFSMLVMLLSGWMVLFVMAMIHFQEPETIIREIPDTGISVRMTLVSTPISASLYIDEPIEEDYLSYRWKFPVHEKNIPLDDLISLKKAKDDTIQLLYEGRLWAIYDPDEDSWNDVLHHDAEEEQTEETDAGKSGKKS